jgi:hypothetical protein
VIRRYLRRNFCVNLRVLGLLCQLKRPLDFAQMFTLIILLSEFISAFYCDKHQFRLLVRSVVVILLSCNCRTES